MTAPNPNRVNGHSIAALQKTIAVLRAKLAGSVSKDRYNALKQKKKMLSDEVKKLKQEIEFLIETEGNKYVR